MTLSWTRRLIVVFVMLVAATCEVADFTLKVSE